MKRCRSFNLLILEEYTLVANNGGCKHVDGKFVVWCFHTDKTESNCRLDCTSYNLCIGFFHGGSNNCRLIPSSENCPETYTLNNREKTVAETTSDLVPDPIWRSSRCYKREPGKTVVHFANSKS